MGKFYRNIFILQIFWFVILCSCGTLKITKQDNYDILKTKQTALKELPMILEMIPKGSELYYGFNNRDEFREINVGEPFNYYNFNGSELEKSSTITVPVVVANEYRALARLDYIKDTLQIVDFGAYALAKEIQIIQKENPNLSFVGLLRIYKIRADFVIMSKSNENIYFPLSSAKTFLQSIGEPIDLCYGQTQIHNIIKQY